MAKSSNEVTKGVENYTVNKFDNGFTVEYSGNNANGDWANAKKIVADEKALIELIKEINLIPRA